MTDEEIKREKTFSEELPYFKERIKEVFDNYSNPNGYEDPLYIDVLRDSKRIVRKAEEEIKRKQAEIENGVIAIPETGIGDLSDGYHTFNELYHHRAILFSVICNVFKNRAWKSKKHHDGTMYDGMFIVGIDTPKGQATYHYDIDPYWDMFQVKELPNAPEWDGHTPDEAINRISTLTDIEIFTPPCNIREMNNSEIRIIKEFAERLKEKSFQSFGNYGITRDVVEVCDIDNLVKEMVGNIE